MAIPLNIAYLATYAKEEFGADCEFKLFKDAIHAIDSAKASPPDILGMSNFYWNRNISIFVANKIKQINPECVVVVGGPNVDTDPSVQYEVYESYMGACDYLVPNEGEVGFANILQHFLSEGPTAPKELEGVVFFDGNRPIAGPKTIGPDLATIPSPFLSGMLDEYLTPAYMPMIQFSRTCPYQCSFCVAARPGKVRGYNLDQQNEEILYIADKYRDHSYSMLMIIDENFGINRNDPKIAEYIVDSYRKTGFPKTIHCYLNKKFNDRTKAIATTFGQLPGFDYVLPFQTFTPESLEATKRKNIKMGELDEITDFAKNVGLKVSTEFISGLPKDDIQGMLHCIDVCFEKDINLAVASLLLFPGIELYRTSEREKYKIKTKYRPTYIPSWINIDGQEVQDFEEVVVSTTTMTEKDFNDLRKVSLIVYAMGHVRLFRHILRFLMNRGYKMSRLFMKMIDPDDEHCVDAQHKQFLADFEAAISGELYDSKEEFAEGMRKRFGDGGKYTGAPTKLNVLFGARLIYEEKWLAAWFRRVFRDSFDSEERVMFEELLEVCDKEWFDVRNPAERMEIEVSVETLRHLGVDGHRDKAPHGRNHLVIYMDDEQIKTIGEFRKNFDGDPDFEYKALEYFRKGSAYGLRYSFEGKSFTNLPLSHLMAKQPGMQKTL